MKCQLYWTAVEELPPAEVWEYYREQLPPALGKRLRQYPTLWDRHQSLCGKLLLQRALNELQGTDDTDYLKLLDYTSKGRPYLCGRLNTDFNISHSGRIVACAVVKGGCVGLDVQQEVPISSQLAQLFLSKEEWSRISTTATNDQLIRIWAKKEAITKATGDGLSVSFSKISLGQHQYQVGTERPIRTKEVFLSSGYACFIASDQKVSALATHYVPAHDLLLNMSIPC